jgi:sugar (pentulose or hexulose) kinase
MNAAAMGLHLGGVLMLTPLALDNVSRPELLRAALENIAFAMRANLEQAEAIAGCRVRRIAIGGGMTRTPAFVRIVADVLGRTVDVAHDYDVTARGAAIVASRAAGTGAIPFALVSAQKPDTANVDGYRRSFDRWDSLRVALDAKMQELP